MAESLSVFLVFLTRAYVCVFLYSIRKQCDWLVEPVVRSPPRSPLTAHVNYSNHRALKMETAGPADSDPSVRIRESLTTGLSSQPTRGHLVITLNITACVVSSCCCKLTSHIVPSPVISLLLCTTHYRHLQKSQLSALNRVKDLRRGTQVRSTIRNNSDFRCGPILTRELSLPGDSAQGKRYCYARFSRVSLVLHVCLISVLAHYCPPSVTVAFHNCFATFGPISLAQMETDRGQALNLSMPWRLNWGNEDEANAFNRTVSPSGFS